MINKKLHIVILNLILLSLTISSNIFCQTNKNNHIENNYNKYKQEFIIEFQNSKNNNQQTENLKNNFCKIHLPEWFFCPTKSNDKIIYVLGISDPEMNKDKAFLLAEIRAKALTSFLLNSNIKGLCDNYSNERKLKNSASYSNLYGEFYIIKSNLVIDTNNFKIEETYFTNYNEAIILTSYIINSNNQEEHIFATFNAEIFNLKKIAKKNHQFNSIININSEISNLINKTKEKFEYKRTSLGKSNKFYSKFSAGKSTINNNYKYSNSKNIETTKYIKESLSNGLWNAYISALMQDIIFSIEDYKVKTENVNDNYTQKLQNITRQKLEKNITASIHTIIIENNKLIIETDIK